MTQARKLSKEEMVALVSKLMNGEYSSDEESSGWIELLAASIPNPNISDLIFWSDKEMTAEEVVEEALKYKPIELGPGTGV